MKYNISKELFEAVMKFHIHLNVNIFEVKDKSIEFTLYERYTRQETRESITINTFFFKCKEWALKQGYMIVTFGNGYFIYNIKELYDPMEELDKWIEDGLSASEQQAVFDATSWILDNKGENYEK